MFRKAALPMRVDTHRHLGGSIPVSWVWDTIQSNRWYHLASSEYHTRTQMTFSIADKRAFSTFLSKFEILNQINWDEKLIDNMIHEVSKEISKDNIDFCWLDFTIDKYVKHLKWSAKEALLFIHDRFQQYLPNKVGLILSLKYESLREHQKEVSKLIDDTDIVPKLFGIDLVGNEYFFDHNFYKPIFRDWAKAGKMTRAHVAESQKSHDGLRTIKDLDIKHIAHGLYIMSDKEAIKAAKDLDIVFDLGLTSNTLTGVWNCRYTHPVSTMIENNLRVTLGTDDPIQCQTNLDKEFDLARRYDIKDDDILKMQLLADSLTKEYLGRL